MKTSTQLKQNSESSVQKTKANNQAQAGSILQAYKKGTAQLNAVEEEENPVQGIFTKSQPEGEGEEEPAQLKQNRTGLPDDLKSGVENLSGHSLDDVKVHYNSFQPAALQAHAYAQGTDIHVAPGQEKHLPHEAWHVVQQKQGRVKPTTFAEGNIPVNDNTGLETEADVMGAKAVQKHAENPEKPAQLKKTAINSAAQLKTILWNDTQNIKQDYNNSPTVNGVVGKEMKAQIDPRDPKKGSSPASGAQYQIYKDLNSETDTQFIKGHMLNANLGGLGITHNLFPITAEANHEHSGSVEENVKQAVIDGYNFGGLSKLYDVHYHVKANIDGDANRFVEKPDAHFDCSAKKVFPDSSEEQIVNRKIYSKLSTFYSKNERLGTRGWGSSGAGTGGSKTGQVGEVSDPTAIKGELSTAGINITGGTVDKVIKRSGKFHSIIFK